MLKRNRLMCLTLLPIFMTPSTVTPFQNQAWQHIEKQVDKNEMVFQTNKLGLIKTDLEIQLEKDRIEFDKQKELLRKQKELKEQKRNEPEWREFELTFYSSLNCENGFGAITSTGSKLFDGVVASNYYKINTKIKLQGWGEVTVLDRGSNKYFNNDYRLDVYVPRGQSESDSHYYSRVNKMGRIKVKGCIINE